MLQQQQQNLSIKKPNNYQLYNSNKINTNNGGNYNQQQQQHIPLAITSSSNADVTTKNSKYNLILFKLFICMGACVV